TVAPRRREREPVSFARSDEPPREGPADELGRKRRFRQPVLRQPFLGESRLHVRPPEHVRHRLASGDRSRLHHGERADMQRRGEPSRRREQLRMGSDLDVRSPARPSHEHESGWSESGPAARLVDAADRADERGLLHRVPPPRIPGSPDVRRIQRCAPPRAHAIDRRDVGLERDGPADRAVRNPGRGDGPGRLPVGHHRNGNLPSRRPTARDADVRTFVDNGISSAGREHRERLTELPRTETAVSEVAFWSSGLRAGTPAKEYVRTAPSGARVPVSWHGRGLMNGKNSGTQSRSRAWVGVLSIIGLMFAATVLGGGAQAAANKFVFHVGDAFLAAVNPDFAPDFALSTATGDRLQLSGTGTFNAGARSVGGGGTFEHRHADGSLFADGSWMAVGIVSWRSYGNGVPQGLPPNFFGGVLVILIEVHPNLPGDPV